VRIMDDLATTERSRWELWAEVSHGRLAVATLDKTISEEAEFVRSGVSAVRDEHRVVQVQWDAKWYPIALRLLRQLAVDPKPVEFVTELLLPFTYACVRDADDPWAAAVELCPGKYRHSE